LYFVQLGGGCLTFGNKLKLHCFRIYRETLSRFSCAASVNFTLHYLHRRSKQFPNKDGSCASRVPIEQN
ncbi:hypothetical protein AAHB54_11435, partial [Bacillus cereus]